MFRLRTGVWSAAFVGLVLLVPIRTDAGPVYNCKSDRALEKPMQFSATVHGARVHLSAFGGSDRSPWVAPSEWRIFDASGKQLDRFPKALLVGGVSRDMLKETNLEGLVPGTAYIIELISTDFCLNAGSVRQPLLLTAPVSDGNLPVVSEPSLVSTGFGGFQSPKLFFSAVDDTGIRTVAVYLNGTKTSDVTYYNGSSFRWWADEYPHDGVKSTLEGPVYTLSYPASYRGQYVLVEIDVVDVFGNAATAQAWLWM
jgi:hypothetical protein